MALNIYLPNALICKECNILKSKTEYDPTRKVCKECRKVYNAKTYLAKTKPRNDLKPKLKRGPKPKPRPFVDDETIKKLITEENELIRLNKKRGPKHKIIIMQEDEENNLSEKN